MSVPNFHRIGLVAKPSDAELPDRLRELVAMLEQRDLEVLVDVEAGELLGGGGGVPRDELAGRVDLLVVLGGDGTLLSISRSAAAADTPVLGVNYGGLGFLTATTPDELERALDLVLSGEYTVDRRRMLRARVVDAGGRDLHVRDVLNDAVINKTELARIVELAAEVDGDLVSSFRADGLIVCSTTGSTAYSLAAGGPIVMPQVDALVLTPICPHTLTNRPLVLHGSAEVRIRQERGGQEVILTLDGQEGIILEPGQSVVVSRSPETLSLLQPLRRSYFEILRTKLHWGSH